MPDFQAFAKRPVLIVVTPDGWMVRRHGKLEGSGPETGAQGWAKAWEYARRLS